MPLRIGAGRASKILEAFGFGRLVVTTTTSAPRARLDDGEHALFADTPEAFAQACRRVLGDEALARPAGHRSPWLAAAALLGGGTGGHPGGYTMARGGAGAMKNANNAGVNQRGPSVLVRQGPIRVRVSVLNWNAAEEPLPVSRRWLR